MDLKILSVHNHGKANEEYVLLEATADCDVGNYLLADSTYTSSGSVSNKLRHVFWFPDKKVKSGDLVSLRTGIGKSGEVINNAGTKVHRFYWNLKTPVWNDDKDCAVLIESANWTHKKAK